MTTTDLTNAQVLDQLAQAAARAEAARLDLAAALDRLAGTAKQDACHVRTYSSTLPGSVGLSYYADATSVRAAEERLDDARVELRLWRKSRQERGLHLPSIDEETSRVLALIGKRVVLRDIEGHLSHVTTMPNIGVQVTVTYATNDERRTADVTGWSVDLRAVDPAEGRAS